MYHKKKYPHILFFYYSSNFCLARQLRVDMAIFLSGSLMGQPGSTNHPQYFLDNEIYLLMCCTYLLKKNKKICRQPYAHMYG